MRIQDIYKALGDYGCLLLCYLKEANIKVDITKYFNELVEFDIIDKDCYVKDANRLLKYFGSELRVVRGVNKNGNTIVPYSYNGREHFVIIDVNKKVVYNTLENSNCVKMGEPNLDKARYLV